MDALKIESRNSHEHDSTTALGEMGKRWDLIIKVRKVQIYCHNDSWWDRVNIRENTYYNINGDPRMNGDEDATLWAELEAVLAVVLCPVGSIGA